MTLSPGRGVAYPTGITLARETPLPASPSDPAAFLKGSGELARLIRAFDWAATPLGPIGGWPQSLKTATGLLLASPVPMVMLWGAEGVMIYNDAYSVFAGQRHPKLLGSNVREGWPEVAEFNDNVMRVGLSGGTLAYTDQELMLNRHGRPEQVWMNLDYSPVPDESGDPAGVLAIVIETTERVLAERRAAAEQERQRQMLRQMPGFVGIMSGPDLIYDYVNDAYAAISERTDFVGRRFRDVFADISGQGFHELFEGVFRSGIGVVTRGMPLRLHGRDEDQYVDFVLEPIRDDAGTVTGVFVGGYETTDVYRSSEALRGSEASLRALNASLEQEVTRRSHVGGKTWSLSTDLLGVANGEGHFENSNPAWQAALGWSQAEIAATPLLSLIHPDDLASTTEALESLRRGEVVLRFENRYRCRDGGYRWLSWVAVPDDDGKFYCSARDITVDKAAEAERERLWTFSADLLARANYSGGMSAVNPAWTTVLGWTEEQLLANPYAEIIDPENIDATVSALEEMKRTGQPTRFENRILSVGGEWKPIGWTVVPEPDGENFIAVGRDLSEDKARGRALLQAQEALRQAQKMEAVGQLTGGIAHDFNNLLAGIIGGLDVIESRLAQGRAGGLDRFIGGARDSARRAASLTQRLLAFSRRQTLDPRPTDVNRLVGGMEDLIRRTVGPGIEVEVVGAGGLWLTRVDGPQLENSLLNLVINARDSMADGGRITIETANKWLDDRAARGRDLPPGQYVSLCVTDTGTGMTDDVIAQAFDPFFTTKPIGKGTGLGLSMIHGFVRQSGGQVRIYSEVGKGTTMCLYLPRYVGELDADEEAEGAHPADNAHGETVLVIDDEPTVRMLIVEVLTDAGYMVIEAEDGPSGLKILRTDARVDLLVTDVGLPGGMNGRQVADAARVARPGLKVLFVTGYAENAAVGNGLLDTGMAVITKPFSMIALGNKVREMIEG